MANASRRRLVLVLALSLFASCKSAKSPDYQDESGLRFTPPAGWVERARPATAAGAEHGRANTPLPKLDSQSGERLLVRYDRLSVDQHAWMRLSVAAVTETMTLEQSLRRRKPGAEWQQTGNVESLQISGKPAARIVWKGKWLKQEYLCESVAVRRGGEVYFLTASFPASEAAIRDQVRQAVGAAILP